ncbi:MAG: YbaB/EbfC family nucleoid-associated protein [Deltaproteobacteria bacterium]|nr:YbaB/EbfC family nucleoid-associated protein [Deltaproteobacteria bacterium]
MFSQIMDQAESMKGRMEDVQSQMGDVTVEGQAGGGLVRVVANGHAKLKSIKIDPVAVDKRDIEMLEDLIVAAVNDALKRAQGAVEQELGKVTGGMDMGAIGNLLGGLGQK